MHQIAMLEAQQGRVGWAGCQSPLDHTDCDNMYKQKILTNYLICIKKKTLKGYF